MLLILFLFALGTTVTALDCLHVNGENNVNEVCCPAHTHIRAPDMDMSEKYDAESQACHGYQDSWTLLSEAGAFSCAEMTHNTQSRAAIRRQGTGILRMMISHANVIRFLIAGGASFFFLGLRGWRRGQNGYQPVDPPTTHCWHGKTGWKPLPHYWWRTVPAGPEGMKTWT